MFLLHIFEDVVHIFLHLFCTWILRVFCIYVVAHSWGGNLEYRGFGVAQGLMA